MYYFCYRCSNDAEDHTAWFLGKDFPHHLFKEHNHRLRILEEVERDLNKIGLLEKSETPPIDHTKNILAMPR